MDILHGSGGVFCLFFLYQKSSLEEISHNNLLVFSARTKCDCQSNAAVPPENLHQVWFCLAMGWSRKVTHVVIGIRMKDQYLFRFRPKTSERAYIHIMKVTETKNYFEQKILGALASCDLFFFPRLFCLEAGAAQALYFICSLIFISNFLTF